MAALARSYQLTPALVAASVGPGVVCLAESAIGRSFRLFSSRPDARLNRRADLPSGSAHVIAPTDAPKLVRVDMMGPIEQRAGYHGECGGWTDGNDAICERLCVALSTSDVLFNGDTPGGAAAGVEQAIERVLAAKAHHGRRITGFADEEIGSLGMWWMLSVCDELFIPRRGRIGSIGARAGHRSIAGALAKEGVEQTYFADPPDKIAFAPELPLSPVGKSRGQRDVKIIADAFRAACCAGAIGQRYKLTPEGLYELGADMLTGEAAVSAGLCDGIASLEEVTAYALKLAEQGGAKGTGSSARQARARGEKNMAIRTEDQEKDARARSEEAPDSDRGPKSSQPPGAPSSRQAGEEPGREIPTKCGAPKCGVENDPDAKFCKGCGASLATGQTPEEEAEAPPPSSSKPGSSLARVSHASFAEILGLPVGASVPAQKTTLLGWQRVVSAASKITGQTDPGAIVGALRVVESDAGKAPRYRRERNEARAKLEQNEKIALAHRLIAAGEERGRVLVDVLDAAGKPCGVKLANLYAKASVADLRGEVEAREARRGPRNPLEPSREDARKIAENLDLRDGGSVGALDAAKRNPQVIALADRTGKPLEAVAEEWVKSGLVLKGRASARVGGES